VSSILAMGILTLLNRVETTMGYSVYRSLVVEADKSKLNKIAKLCEKIFGEHTIVVHQTDYKISNQTKTVKISYSLRTYRKYNVHALVSQIAEHEGVLTVQWH